MKFAGYLATPTKGTKKGITHFVLHGSVEHETALMLGYTLQKVYTDGE